MDIADCVTRNVVLPDRRYAGLWDSIVTPVEVKSRLLHAALLSGRLRGALPFDVTALHGLALLTGPPGTGKSTLARGLPSKVGEALGGTRVRFVEVNPHGLMSAEHGQSQQRVSRLLTEHIPLLADDRLPTIVLLDEIETMAVARGAASLEANPADVHRATDAVLTALDDLAISAPHIFMVATSNFTDALDSALMSRADVTLHVPLPGQDAIATILTNTLSGFAEQFPGIARLAASPEIKTIAATLEGVDGRAVRKLVTEALAMRIETTLNPGDLTLDDLSAAARALNVTREQGGPNASH
ncbi:AAA family ATPase [Cellulomonas biazotea]|uniref:AAA family ATPase n=1 Tax=Cellulomonas biazotea TaxID=1709 RepID=UPI001C3F569A|nr:AAA family ATPase [Cellulomonas biazotea]